MKVAGPVAGLAACLLLMSSASHAPAQTSADSAWTAGNHVLAERLFAQRLAADSNDLTALRRVAMLRAWNARYDESIALFDRALRLAPQDAELVIQRARVLAWARRYASAIASVDSLLARDNDNRAALLGLAEVLSLAGRTDSAAVIFNRMIARDPRDAEAWKGLARAASWSNSLHNGEQHWRRAIEIAPNDAEAWAGLGTTLRWQGRDAAAVETLRRALALEPGNIDARRQLAEAEAAVAPRASPAYIYEADSDRNRMQTFNAIAGARITQNLEARAEGYIRDLSGIDLSGTSRDVTTNGGMLGLTLHTNQGWMVSGAAGVSGNGDVADASTSARVTLSTPRWLPVTGTLSYHRAAFDYTAALAIRGVRTDQVAADAAARLGARSQLTGNIAATQYQGIETNEQLSGGVAITHRVWHWLTAGMATRAFGFDKDRDELIEGYFNPDFYGLAELVAAASHQTRRWILTAELAPGYQQIGSDGDRTSSFRSNGRVSYAIAPGRQIGLSAVYANSGIQQLSPTASSEYSYRAFSVFGSWAF